MVVVRVLALALLLASALCFAMFVLTGDARYRRLGLVILKWTVFAGLAFFAVLAIERLR